MSLDLFQMQRTLLESQIVGRVAGRDYERECGYPATITLEQYHRAYQRNGFCQRIVHLMPDECAQLAPEITEKDSEEAETPWEATFKEHAQSVNLWHYIQEADKQAGIGRYGILLIGLSDGKKLSEPATRGKGLRVIYMRPYAEGEVSIVRYVNDPTNARYGKPEFYQINTIDLSGENETGAVMPTIDAVPDTLQVHWSRVLHFSDSGEVLSQPRLKRTWNWAHVDLSKLVGGGAEMFWRGAFPGFFFSVDPSVDMADEDKKTAIKESSFSYFNTLTRAMHMQGVTVQQLNPVIADPTAQFSLILQLCAISENCPLPVFTGAQPGGLSADSGIRGSDEWSIRKQARRDRYLIPKIIRAYIDMMIQYGVLGPMAYEVVYKDPHTLTAAEKATNALMWIKTISEYITKGCDTLISPLSFLTEIMGMDMERATRIMDSLEAYAASAEADEAVAAADVEAVALDQATAEPTFDAAGNPVPTAPAQAPKKVSLVHK